MRSIEKVVGLFSAAGGVFLILMILAFSSMSDPGGVQPVSRTLGRVAAEGAYPIGLLLILAGLWLAKKPPAK